MADAATNGSSKRERDADNAVAGLDPIAGGSATEPQTPFLHLLLHGSLAPHA
jgi:hypothetical protein